MENQLLEWFTSYPFCRSQVVQYLCYQKLNQFYRCPLAGEYFGACFIHNSFSCAHSVAVFQGKQFLPYANLHDYLIRCMEWGGIDGISVFAYLIA